ncbi:acyltransferase [Maribacter sp. CXY002]|uniref:acyltransferase n=1 Tax=Maribacter luteocoastalis TaxID=3407671 RepID=UPI003B66BC2C
MGRTYRLLFSHKNLKIGRNFQCYTFPKILLDKTAKIQIGDNVVLRRNVEIRAHGNSTLNLGNHCRIDRGVRLLAANNAKLHLGNNVRIGLYSVFNGGDSITIGDKTLISGFVYLQTSMHNFQGKTEIQSQGYAHKPIVLGEDVWIGTHAVIFPGVLLEKGCVVGSSSIVNKSFESYSVIAGSPAKILKNREF